MNAAAAPLRLDLLLRRPDFALRVQVELPGTGITVIGGPSGSGKTTLLRCVAGLERATGEVCLGDKTWQSDAQALFVPTWQRKLGYVFQEASLFAHLNVQHNLEYGLRRNGLPGDARALDEAVELLGIGHLRQRQTHDLSGGERQRVAIARALACAPQILLLDEPLAALDAARRQEILPWLERLRDSLRIPVLYVTHSTQEMTRLADHVLWLQAGEVRACGTATDVLGRTDWATEMGDDAGALLHARVTHIDPTWHLACVDVGGDQLWVRDDQLQPGQAVRLRLLARDVSLALSEAGDSTIQNRLWGVVQSVTPERHAAQALVAVRCAQSTVLARVTHRALHQLGIGIGTRVCCQVKSVALVR